MDNKRLELRLPPEVYEALKKEADGKGLPLATFVRLICLEHLEKAK